MHPVYIGYDPREADAYQVCCASIRAHAHKDFSLEPVSGRLLGALYRRPETRRGGVLWDEISQRPMSTEFSLARFMVPSLAVTGAALFVDCDFLFRANIHELFAHFDPRYAVQVVKQRHDCEQGEGKMDGQLQNAHERKNWSSCMLINADLCNQYLSREDVNTRHRDYLHTFAWLPDELIGEIPREWNYLVGVSEHIDEPKAVHFTLGIPSMPGYEQCEYAEEWRAYAHQRR